MKVFPTMNNTFNETNNSKSIITIQNTNEKTHFYSIYSSYSPENIIVNFEADIQLLPASKFIYLLISYILEDNENVVKMIAHFEEDFIKASLHQNFLIGSQLEKLQIASWIISQGISMIICEKEYLLFQQILMNQKINAVMNEEIIVKISEYITPYTLKLMFASNLNINSPGNLKDIIKGRIKKQLTPSYYFDIIAKKFNNNLIITNLLQDYKTVKQVLKPFVKYGKEKIIYPIIQEGEIPDLAIYLCKVAAKFSNQLFIYNYLNTFDHHNREEDLKVIADLIAKNFYINEKYICLKLFLLQALLEYLSLESAGNFIYKTDYLVSSNDTNENILFFVGNPVECCTYFSILLQQIGMQFLTLQSKANALREKIEAICVAFLNTKDYSSFIMAIEYPTIENRYITDEIVDLDTLIYIKSPNMHHYLYSKWEGPFSGNPYFFECSTPFALFHFKEDSKVNDFVFSNPKRNNVQYRNSFHDFLKSPQVKYSYQVIFELIYVIILLAVLLYYVTLINIADANYENLKSTNSAMQECVERGRNGPNRILQSNSGGSSVSSTGLDSDNMRILQMPDVQNNSNTNNIINSQCSTDVQALIKEADESYQVAVEICKVAYILGAVFVSEIYGIFAYMFLSNRKQIKFYGLTSINAVRIVIFCIDVVLLIIFVYSQYQASLVDENQKNMGMMECLNMLYTFQIFGLQMGLIWVRMFFRVKMVKAFGPLIQTFEKILKESISFLFIYFLVIIAFGCVGTVAFGNFVDSYKTFVESLYTLYQAALGNFDFTQFNSISINGAVMKEIGRFYLAIFLLLSMILLINILIAILSEIYSNTDESKEEMHLKIVYPESRILQFDDTFSCLVSGFFPLNFVFFPFHLLLGFSFGKYINLIILHIQYSFILLLNILAFLGINLVMGVIAYFYVISKLLQGFVSQRKRVSILYKVIEFGIFIIFGILIIFVSTFYSLFIMIKEMYSFYESTSVTKTVEFCPSSDTFKLLIKFLRYKLSKREQLDNSKNSKFLDEFYLFINETNNSTRKAISSLYQVGKVSQIDFLFLSNFAEKASVNQNDGKILCRNVLTIIETEKSMKKLRTNKETSSTYSKQELGNPIHLSYIDFSNLYQAIPKEEND